ncbi:plasmid recombination protein [Shewanella avicenniae]|uniref:Plasmid recombination protein n=1 Tax=Shewanella avicenniae TaxID=2814294 RepID=A0ABX7QUF7_9GAMM|nr:MobV family relaxase [Shewanella avicenniae]QSX35131.1 plasmid recombination protein [Shewanella avicenniae]
MKQDFAIFRIGKLKSKAEISAMSAHWRRTKPTPNVDPTKTKFNRVLMGAADPYKAFCEGVTQRGITKFRKNGVFALEAVLAFSPSFIIDESGKYLPDAKDKLTQWIKLSKDWLQEEFGERVLSAYLHADERNFHIHCCIHVFELKQRRNGAVWGLNARAITGGADKLRRLQDSYSSKMNCLGLKRGIRGSKATHSTVSQFYNAINEAKDVAQSLGLNPPTDSPTAFSPWLKNVEKVITALQKQQQVEKTKLLDLIQELRDTNQRLNYQLQSGTPRRGIR